MEDYIFLLIAIAISIFAAINKSKKKKMAENDLENESERPRNYFMDQLLGEDFLDEPIKETTPPVRIKQIPDFINTAGKNEYIQQKYYHQDFKTSLPERQKRESITALKKQNEPEEITETEDSSNYLEDFSLRKAIIYSSILEQKYYP